MIETIRKPVNRPTEFYEQPCDELKDVYYVQSMLNKDVGELKIGHEKMSCALTGVLTSLGKMETRIEHLVSAVDKILINHGTNTHRIGLMWKGSMGFVIAVVGVITTILYALINMDQEFIIKILEALKK